MVDFILLKMFKNQNLNTSVFKCQRAYWVPEIATRPNRDMRTAKRAEKLYGQIIENISIAQTMVYQWSSVENIKSAYMKKERTLFDPWRRYTKYWTFHFDVEAFYLEKWEMYHRRMLSKRTQIYGLIEGGHVFEIKFDVPRVQGSHRLVVYSVIAFKVKLS